MRLSPEQRVEHRLEGGHDSLGHARRFLEEEHFFALHSYTNAFTQFLTAGLIQWRRDLADPRPALDQASHAAILGLEAILVSREHAEVVFAGYRRGQRRPGGDLWVPWRPWRVFDYTAAVHVSILLEDRPNQRLLDEVCDVREWDRYEKGDWDNFLFACPLRALLEGEPPEPWPAIVAHGQERTRLRLCANTGDHYMRLVQAMQAKVADRVISLVRKLERLFARRRRSSFLGGGITYLSGDRDTVDFQLASFLKYGLRDQPELLERIDTIHKWQW